MVKLLPGAFLRMLMPAGNYIEKCAPDKLGRDRYKLYDAKRNPLRYVLEKQINNLDAWRVLKKIGPYAEGSHPRYILSRRKILSLRKNNRIKWQYKRLRSQPLASQ